MRTYSMDGPLSVGYQHRTKVFTHSDKIRGGGLDDHDFLTIWPTSGCHGQMVKNF